MKKEFWWSPLQMFAAGLEGAEEPSDTTPRTTETGDLEESAPDAGETTTAKTRQEEFRTLMEGEYKDLFTAYFQETFNRRFKEQKSIREELGRCRAVVEAAARRFGTENEAELLAILSGEHDVAATTEKKTAEHAREELERAVETAVREARETTEQAVIASIRARGLRPSENGTSNGGGVGFENAARRLSRAERAEMARRAVRGECIKF